MKTEETTIKSFADFIDIIEVEAELVEDHIGTLFRGQPFDKPLLPKLARNQNYYGIKILSIEKKILREFEKKSRLYLDFNPFSTWDYLALAQHSGLPTRLLDWTENPLIALWFACEKEIKKNEYGVVWLFDVDQDKDLVSGVKESPFTGNRTKVYNPYHISERISRQLGWFTVHKFVEKTKNFIPLENNRLYKEALEKIIIPSKLFKEIRLKLNIMGVNASTIFSDLDGLCKFLQWKYFKK